MLTGRERDILTAVAARIVGNDADLGAIVTRAEELVGRADEVAQADLRRALSFLDSPAVGLLTTGIPLRFVACSPRGQEARLASLRRSRWKLLRALYIGVQRLCLTCHYSAPASWEQIGYPGPPAMGRET